MGVSPRSVEIVHQVLVLVYFIDIGKSFGNEPTGCNCPSRSDCRSGKCPCFSNNSRCEMGCKCRDCANAQPPGDLSLFYLGLSPIPAAGSGVFAREQLPKNFCVAG